MAKMDQHTRLRILLLSYEFPPLGGGAANAVDYLVRSLTQIHGSRVMIDVITGSPGSKDVVRLSDSAVMYRLDIGKNEVHLQHQRHQDVLRYAVQAYFFSKKMMQAQQYDLVHAFMGIPGGIVASFLEPPYVISLRGSDVPYHNPSYRYMYAVMKSLIYRSWKKAGAVVVNSDDLQNEAEHFLRRDYAVIPNGVDINKFSVNTKRSSVFRVLFVGRLHRIKNIPLLLRSFKKFSQRISSKPVELVLIGDGPERRQLVSYCKELNIQDTVVFSPHVPHHELPSSYQHASVFVLVSEREGMSNTLLEAMASGLPVITTKTGGSDMLVKSNGYVVDPNEEDISEALYQVYINPDRQKEMGVYSRSIAERFHWENMADQYFQLYQRLCVV
ncbi:MAG: hypothetical protein A3J66_03165 [Candidatus Magasanikbacteria bacterium RIFCSPHIGHO2_02_FULL_47_14]|uniref:Glycosyl transferase family 1 domain-containing protein n=1 Tax=Candidatus Magasanikbacteria bacterium RIFCSPHIGHO2_02_FULL_47_14 TaxID=1798680 RepID=A0A1F6MAH1_9BACT|nr:MAG: hypothetical protein A3J66_03165 [Candidatus Magasanikbacteria bacterium RIFCSPHIGHO2_02_FULL_47_14]